MSSEGPVFLPGDRRVAVTAIARILGFPLRLVIPLAMVAWLLGVQGWVVRAAVGAGYLALLVLIPSVHVWMRTGTSSCVTDFVGRRAKRVRAGVWQSEDGLRRIRRWRDAEVPNVAFVSFERLGEKGWEESERRVVSIAAGIANGRLFEVDVSPGDGEP